MLTFLRRAEPCEDRLHNELLAYDCAVLDPSLFWLEAEEVLTKIMEEIKTKSLVRERKLLSSKNVKLEK